MNLKRQWIMNEQQYQLFVNYRKKNYQQVCLQHNLQYFQDEILLQFYIKNHLLSFLRRRYRETDNAFKFEKVIHTAVCFFKRYFLINSFMEQQPTQAIICSIYLSLKIHQYDESSILKSAHKWRNKEQFQPKRNHLHYGQQNYTEKQLKFLKGFGFQIGRSPLICPIESLYLMLMQNNLKNLIDIVAEIKLYLDKIYLHPKIIFLVEGPKLALAIVLCVLRKKQICFEFLGAEINQLIAQQQSQIQHLMIIIDNIEEYSVKRGSDFDKINLLRRMTKRVKFKKPDVRRCQIKKSPKFYTRHQPYILE